MPRIEDHEQNIVSDRCGSPRMGASPPRKPASQHLDHERQSKTFVRLVPAHRQDRSGRLVVKLVRISRRIAIRVEDPAEGHTLSGDSLDPHFSFGCGARAEIENEWSL